MAVRTTHNCGGGKNLAFSRAGKGNEALGESSFDDALSSLHLKGLRNCFCSFEAVVFQETNGVVSARIFLGKSDSFVLDKEGCATVRVRSTPIG